MIDITKNIKRTKGVIPAITKTCVEIMEKHLKSSNITFKPIKDVEKAKRILTHMDPHIDEYMAALLLRAGLPEDKKMIPLEETYLSSVNNDIYAKATWPEAILLGFGGTHNGGARAAVKIDEHIEEGKKPRFSSVTQMVRLFYMEGKLSKPLGAIYKEIDHIDGNGGAYDLNLGRLARELRSVDIFMGKNSEMGGILTTRMDSAWKEASVYACIIAILKAKIDKVPFTSEKYWNEHIQNDVEESLNFYRQHSIYAEDPKKEDKEYPEFHDVFSMIKTNYTNRFQKNLNNKVINMYLTVKGEDGSLRVKADKAGIAIPQIMMMPYVISLCKTYWGEKLANIILFPFWEYEIQKNMAFRECRKAIKDILDQNPNKTVYNVPTNFGKISIMYPDYTATCQKYGGYGKDGKRRIIGYEERPVVIFDLSSIFPAAGSAAKNIINTDFDGAGFCIVRDMDKNNNNIMVSRCKNITMEEWEKVIKELIRLDGNSDSRKRVGKWHITQDDNGKPAEFILNGTAPHKYVRKVTRSPHGFLEIIKRAHVQ